MRERKKERNELILFVFQMYKLKAHYFFSHTLQNCSEN